MPNLFSCPHCGVVYNGDLVTFPKLIHNPDMTINKALAGWDGENWVAKIHCRVCQEPILKTHYSLLDES